jgi:NitT/TauT family transport system ATP-binding protein
VDPEELKKKNLLHLQDVYKSYGPKLVLDNSDFSVAHGELCTVVGPSGCGKSTLLRLILGEEAASSGVLLVDGQPISAPDNQRGIVYQKYSLFPHLTVLENVAMGKILELGILERWRAKKRIKDEALYFLTRIGLQEHWNKYPHELSGGMQQRVAIAQALIMKPRILLMDEPFGALDPSTRESMQLFLLELWEELKMTVFFVTHDLEEAVFVGTRIIVLSQYYSDGRGTAPGVGRGAKIVADYFLEKTAQSTRVKVCEQFLSLIQKIRVEGFDPKYIHKVTEFNLKHPDSFQTLTAEERC